MTPLMRQAFRAGRAWGMGFVLALALAALGYLTPSRVDPGPRYWLQFGRGSGWHGLDTVKVCDDGSVTLHRRVRVRQRISTRGFSRVIDDVFWTTTTLELRPRSLAQVRDAVEENRLFELDRRYSAGVADGEQWVLWIRRGEKQQAVYFDNRFPDEIVRFAATLDEVLNAHGLQQSSWRRVGGPDARGHERALWDSIRR